MGFGLQNGYFLPILTNSLPNPDEIYMTIGCSNIKLLNVVAFVQWISKI